MVEPENDPVSEGLGPLEQAALTVRYEAAVAVLGDADGPPGWQVLLQVVGRAAG